MKLQKLSYFLLLTVLFTIYSQVSFAQNNAACAGLNFNTQTALIHTDTELVKAIPISVFRSSSASGDCSFYLTIDNGGANNYDKRVLKWGSHATMDIQFYTQAPPSNIFYSNKDPLSSANMFMGTFTGSTYIWPDFTYYAQVTPNGIPGTYSNNFTIQLFEGSVKNNKADAQSSVNFSYKMVGIVNISLVDTGAPYNELDTVQTLDFGNLVTGDTKGFDIVLDYNSGYSLSMSSANSGKIKNTNAAITSANLISYSMTLGGASISLSSNMEVKSSGDAGQSSPTGGRRLPVSVTIGNVTGAAPGTYTDTVSISVTSLN